MRVKAIYLLSAAATLLIAYNLYTILLVLPDEVQQGAIYRIIFFHVPAAFTAFSLFFLALCGSVIFLISKNYAFDSFAAATTEVGLAFATINLVTGSIWARNQWGIWWTWDARLTSMFLCWLLYVGYLALRPAIEDPTQRATLSAVVSIFAFADVPIVYFSIQWFRTQHPSPVLTTGKMDSAFWPPLLLNWLAFALISAALVMVRLRQEQVQRVIDSVRREALAI